MFKKTWNWLLKSLEPLFVYRSKKDIEFSYGGYLIFVGIQCLILWGLIVLISNYTKLTTFDSQFHSPWYSYIAWFIPSHFLMHGFEWVYHRYLLHKVVFKWFASQCIEHHNHHGITNITEDDNQYPIVDHAQIESSTFPVYALAIFLLVFGLLFIAPVQMFLPGEPVLVSCLSSVVFSVVLYETFHAAMHMDYDRHWRKLVEKYAFWRQVYGFHLMHHRHVGINLAVGGFFGLALADRFAGTRFVPHEHLPLPGKEDVCVPSLPDRGRMVTALDKGAENLTKWLKRRSNKR